MRICLAKTRSGQGCTSTLRHISYVLSKVRGVGPTVRLSHCLPRDETSLTSFLHRTGRYSADGQPVIARIQVLTFSVAQSVTPGSQASVQIKMDTRSIGVGTTGRTAASSAGVWQVSFLHRVLAFSFGGVANSGACGVQFSALCNSMEQVLPLVQGHMLCLKTLRFYYLKHCATQKEHICGTYLTQVMLAFNCYFFSKSIPGKIPA